MLELNNYWQDGERIKEIYEEVKSIILSKPNYEYQKYHYINDNLYTESGSVEFENSDNQNFFVEIKRWHWSQCRGDHGLNGIPNLRAYIYTISGEEKELLWQLESNAYTFNWDAKVTSLELPYDILSSKDEKVLIKTKNDNKTN